MKKTINKILNFIKPKAMTRISHNGKLLMEFESIEPKEIIFVMDTRAEITTFKKTENEAKN